ncbi:hypothetical protein MLD38_006873 [Melastoma candidum]|uniref:Uncharacterized protein n=1 Tax=Melastoma candidum TaxID=119954 RepID=A0ACB9RP00_9MYRT|nr:hypothetical protein MLD38_006873 [Melastoma candidum]
MVEDIDEVLDQIKKTWTVLGMNQALRIHWFAWVLPHQYVATGQEENDLLYAASNLLSEVEEDSRTPKDQEYLKFSISTLKLILGWTEKSLLAYHDTFHCGNIDLLQNLVSMSVSPATILADQVSHEHGRKKADANVARQTVETYIRTSSRALYSQANIRELVITEKEIFSLVFKRWHPLPAVLIAADKLEKDLVQIALEDSVDSEDGGKEQSYFHSINASPLTRCITGSKYNRVPKKKEKEKTAQRRKSQLGTQNLDNCLGVLQLCVLPGLSLFLQELESYLETISSTVHDRVRTRLITNVMKASFDGFLMILLAGGPRRAFSLEDCQIIDEDFKFLEELFWSNGDGLPADLINKYSSSVKSILPLFRANTDTLIEQFKHTTLESCSPSAKSMLSGLPMSQTPCCGSYAYGTIRWPYKIPEEDLQLAAVTARPRRDSLMPDAGMQHCLILIWGGPLAGCSVCGCVHMIAAVVSQPRGTSWIVGTIRTLFSIRRGIWFAIWQPFQQDVTRVSLYSQRKGHRCFMLLVFWLDSMVVSFILVNSSFGCKMLYSHARKSVTAAAGSKVANFDDGMYSYDERLYLNSMRILSDPFHS